jgi:hypothetical protein
MWVTLSPTSLSMTVIHNLDYEDKNILPSHEIETHVLYHPI